MAVADQLVERLQLGWGPVAQIWPPRQGPDGRRWWQVDFHSAPTEGDVGVVLVDADSAWARLAPLDWPLRQSGRDSGAHELPQRGSRTVSIPRAGTWILVLDGSPDDREIADWNAAARRQGLPPLFARWQPRGAEARLVYGWNGEEGIQPDAELAAWVRSQGPWRADTWLDLTGEL